MKLQVIRDLAVLTKIDAEWSSFTRSLTGLTPFQFPVWLLTWWRYFGSGELRVIVFQENGAIAGIVPCFLHEWQGARQMTLIGSGISDYLEPAISLELTGEVTNELRCYLESASDWDVCNWQDLSFETPLRKLSSCKLEAKAVEETECRQLHLRGEFAEYWKARPASLRQNVRRGRAKAESMAILRFVVTSEANPELLDGLIRLHGARWQAHGEPGTIAANRSADFLVDIARQFAARDMLRIFALLFDEHIAAVILAFCYANTIFNYVTAFDPEFEHLGVGRTLLFEAIRHSFENGYDAWDFLRGNEAYKSWWGAEAVPKCRLIITRR